MDYTSTNNETTNNNRDNFSATTSLIQFFNDNIQLRLSGHDTGLSIGIWEPLSDPMTGKMTYPKEKRYSLFVSADKVMALSELLDTLLDSYKKGENKTIGVFTKQDRSNMIEISYRDGDFYLAIHKGIDPATLIPKFTTEFKFAKTTIITNYNRTDGKIEVEELEGYFYLFNKIVLDYTTAGCGIYGHSIRNTNKTMNDKMFRYLNEIALKVGASVQTFAGYQSQSNNVYSNYNSPQATNEPDSNYNELNTLEGLL